MRCSLAGLLILFTSSVALAQASGEINVIGFGNCYRPDCWTPMRVQLKSESSDTQTLQIQVVQDDLDHDRVMYSQLITLSGNTANSAPRDQQFWVYFRPSPTEGGLPDADDPPVSGEPNAAQAELNKRLKVWLCSKDGKLLKQIPIKTTIFSVDRRRPSFDKTRSRKFVVYVQSADSVLHLDSPAIFGLMEDTVFVAVRPDQLPENVLGYEGIDALLWLDGDANQLSGGTRSRALEAIQTWVREGGHLVVCQPTPSGLIRPLAGLLPVTPPDNGEDWTIPQMDRFDSGAASWQDSDVLHRMVHREQEVGGSYAWPSVSGPFKVSRAVPTADAKVDEWIMWKRPQTEGPPVWTPYIARRPLGLGCVTWVAQDLGSDSVKFHSGHGWQFIWDRVFDWHNATQAETPVLPNAGEADPMAERWGPDEGVDAGFSLLDKTELAGKTANYIILACLCFVGYWAIAGPGVYWALAIRKQTHLSWYAYGASAVIAGVLTALLVRLVVRGPPELRHLSIIRYAAGQNDAIIYGDLGLYIPQDGLKQISLQGVSGSDVSYITSFPAHPQNVSEDAASVGLEYQIPVRDVTTTDPVVVNIPYRSTLKKLQAKWVGPLSGRIELPLGAPMIKVFPSGDEHKPKLEGSFANHTGQDLNDVYLAFERPEDVAAPEIINQVILAYVPSLKKDEVLDLATVLTHETELTKDFGSLPQHPCWGYLGKTDRPQAWENFWYLRSGENLAKNLDEALPFISFFELIRPVEKIKDGIPSTRWEMYRRGARMLDMSGAVSAGQLVVVAASVGPVPFPLQVSDSPVTGDGLRLYQFVLPLDRSAVNSPPPIPPEILQKPTTASSTQPVAIPQGR